MIDFALDSRIFLNNEFDIAMQELDILFNTENTELIGNPQFGTNFEQFLWQLNPSPNELKRYINEKISGTMFFILLENCSVVYFILFAQAGQQIEPFNIVCGAVFHFVSHILQ